MDEACGDLLASAVLQAFLEANGEAENGTRGRIDEDFSMQMLRDCWKCAKSHP